MTENKKSPKKVKDFDKLAIADPGLSAQFFQPEPISDSEGSDYLTMDSTSVVEFSYVKNHEYSGQIITRARKAFDLSKLEKLKEKKNQSKYLDGAKDQVIELYSCMESLETHSAVFRVSLLIAIGIILDDVEAYWGKKSKYMKWLRADFGHKHIRYFQHAKQLAKMGEFARKYAALGKNRLLEFARIKTDLMTKEDDILTRHPFPDITDDMDGVLFKEHVDAIITYYRMIEAEIQIINFDQAGLIAAMLHKSISVKTAKEIKEWLDKFEAEEKKKEVLEHFLLNGLYFPYESKEEESVNPPKESLNRVIGKVLDYYDKISADENWIQKNENRVNKDALNRVLEVISSLISDFKELNETNQNNKNSEGGNQND